MLKRLSRPTVLAAVVLLGACGDQDPLSPDGEPGPAVAAQVARPALVNGEAMVPITWTYRVSPIYDGSMVACPGGFVFPVHWSFDARLTHLGRLDRKGSTATFTACAAGEDPQLGPYFAGDAGVHLTGPQGDAVDLEGTLTLLLAAGYATGDWDIVGGAGRFAGARGHIDTVEYPEEDGSGSAGSGTGMITRPRAVTGGRPGSS